MLPKARTDNITIRELTEELLVFDHERMKAHCLNGTAAFLWRHCDGQTDIDQLVALVERELHIPDAAPVVQLALQQLSRRRLLEQELTPLSAEQRLSRRDALKKMAIAAVALPVIMSLAAPKARASYSFEGASICSGPDGSPCVPPHPKGSLTLPGVCCGGICITGTSCPGTNTGSKTPACLPSGTSCAPSGGTPCCSGSCINRGAGFVCA